MSYYCEQCGHRHKLDSKIGREHWTEEARDGFPVGAAAAPAPEAPRGEDQGGPAPAAPAAEAPGEAAPGGGGHPVAGGEGEAQEQLRLLAEALGIDKLTQMVKAQQIQIAQLTRHQGEILQGAAPTTGGLDLTKYGITTETLQSGVKWVVNEIFKGGGGGDDDEQMIRAIWQEEKARKALVMKEKIKAIYDAINNDLPLYAGEAPPGPLTPKKDGDKK